MPATVDCKKIGLRLAARRRECKMTQGDISKAVGISKNQVCAIEKGGNTSMQTFLNMCAALRVSPDYILEGAIKADLTAPLAEIISFCSENEIAIIKELACSLINHRDSEGECNESSNM